MLSSGSSNFSEEPAGAELDPSIFDRTFANASLPLRRVLNRDKMWNQRHQHSAYEFNLHDRVQRVFTAWENGDPEYGSRDQMARDLSEISAMSDVQPITNAQQTFSEDAESPDSSLDKETQCQLQGLLEELTLSLGNDKEAGLTHLAGLLSDVAQPAEPLHPGIHSNPRAVSLSLTRLLLSVSISLIPAATNTHTSVMTMSFTRADL
jgi:hypothetical protein